MKSSTHILGIDGRCERCGAEVPPVKDKLAHVGQLIGVLEDTNHTDAVAYVVGEHDSNLPCAKITKVETSTTTTWGMP